MAWRTTQRFSTNAPQNFDFHTGHKFRGQTREDLVCPAARALALKWGKACAVAYPALTVLAVCSIGPEGVT